ncbi:MAG TPA: sigma-70 family RNA polymerase sigma factor [Solirubrobacteraceae bacterium]|nr:sigma-70 family RNA polymerase sigma factor [Solirubrobacteraceae bacterium]
MPRTTPIIYCVIPADLAGELHESLREHFRDEPGVQVVVEQRSTDRRSAADRRAARAEKVERDRRELRARSGRRVEERRADQRPIDPPALPEAVEPLRDRLRFVERDEPTSLAREDADTARMVVRIQTGDKDLIGPLYLRYFDRVYAYLRITLQDSHEAEDAAQAVFIRVLEALPNYERRDVPFRAWLFRIVRNDAINRLRQRQRLTVESPDEVVEQGERVGAAAPPGDDAVDWIGDTHLLAMVERLPLSQRQVVVLRYMMDFNTVEIGELLDRSPEAIRQLHHRAMRYLRQRVTRPEEEESGYRRSQRKAVTRLPRHSPVLHARKRVALGG